MALKDILGGITGLISKVVAGPTPTPSIDEGLLKKVQEVRKTATAKGTKMPTNVRMAVEKVVSPTAERPTTKVVTGKASTYDKDFFSGKDTTSEEKYDPNALTAAMRLPVKQIREANTYVRVTNPANNQSVVVRVNDWGPHKRFPERVIDLSTAATKKIFGTEQTLSDVRVEFLGSPIEPAETEPAKEKKSILQKIKESPLVSREAFNEKLGTEIPKYEKPALSPTLERGKKLFGELMSPIKTIAQGTMRETAAGALEMMSRGVPSIGIGVNQLIPKLDEPKFTLPEDASSAEKAAYKLLFGENKTLGGFEETGRETLQAVGAEKLAKGKTIPYVVGGVLAMLDLTTGGGKAKVIQEMIKIDKFADAVKLGKKIGVADDLLSEFGKLVVKVKNKMEAESILDAIKTLQKNVAKSKVVDNAMTKVSRVVNDLAEIFNKHEKLRSETTAARSAEMSARFGRAENIFQQGLGAKGAKIGISQLKGAMPTAELSSELAKDVKKVMTAENVDTMLNAIQQHPYLNTGQKVNAIKALGKVGTDVLTPSELQLMKIVFGENFSSALKSQVPLDFTFLNIAQQVNGSMKVLLSSFLDLSYTLRQGILYAARHPIKMLKIVPESAHAMISPKYYQMVSEQITNHQYYTLAKMFGVPFTELSGAGVKMSKMEEEFLTSWIQRIPGFGDIVEATNRSFNLMANKVRMDWFGGLADDLIRQGFNPTTDPLAFKKAANFVGAATGRANLGQTLDEATGLLNLVAYSPRLIASRAYFLNPLKYFDFTPTGRATTKEMWKTVGSFTGMVATTLAIAKAAGADVETDPRSTDFGKIKVGDRRWDITGGFGTYIVYLSRMISGKTKTEEGKIQDVNRIELTQRFLEGKLSPIMGTGIAVGKLLDNLTQGANRKDITGQTVTPGNLLMNHFVNMTAQDVIEASKDPSVGWLNALLTTGIPSLMGVGTQTYLPRETDKQFKVKSY